MALGLFEDTAHQSLPVTDFAYGTGFASLCLILFCCGQVYSARNIIVLVFVMLWGARLALYLFARVLKEGKDARFDGTRDHFFKFMAFWIAQTVVRRNYLIIVA